MRYRCARVRPRPPRITPCQGHPRDKQEEEVVSAPGPSIDLVRAGGFSQSDPPPQPNRVTAAIVIPVMNAAMQVNTNTLSRRLAFMAFLPNRGTPRIPQEGTGILVPRYRAAAGDFFQ